MALGSSQLLTEMSTTRCVRRQPLHLNVLIVLKSASLNLLEPLGPVVCLHRDCYTFKKQRGVMDLRLTEL